MSADAPADVVLKGPMPEVPPGLLLSPWTWSAVILLGGVIWGLALLRKGRPAPADPADETRRAIDAALALPPEQALTALAGALRRYVAAVEPHAPAGLSTEELERRLGALPEFMPARQPLIAALRAADASRFAGAETDPALVAAAAREAVNRTEAARGAFARAS